MRVCVCVCVCMWEAALRRVYMCVYIKILVQEMTWMNIRRYSIVMSQARVCVCMCVCVCVYSTVTELSGG